MTISSARFARDTEKNKVPIRRAALPSVSLMTLANRMREDVQLWNALQVPGTALVGLAADGVPLMIRLASPDVTHVLITGGRTSGKSRLAATIAASLVLHQKPREIQIFVLTQEPQPFQFLAAAPHTQRVIAAVDQQILEQMRRLESEMERREQQQMTRPRLVVLADALPDWDKDSEREYQVRLARLAQRGRSAGISLIICQGEDAAVNPRLYPYFPVQLSAVPHTRDTFDLFAGGERVCFQTALLSQEELPAFYEQLELQLHPRPQTAGSRVGEMLGRLKRSF